MDDELKIKLYSTMIDCKDAVKLAEFYAKLLKWEKLTFDEVYTCVYPPNTLQGAYPIITFQHDPDYVPPVWPAEPKAQQTMEHLDFVVNDLEKAVAHAIECGAAQAKNQYSDNWRVMIDPEGHPFCLCIMKEVMESPNFALL